MAAPPRLSLLLVYISPPPPPHPLPLGSVCCGGGVGGLKLCYGGERGEALCYIEGWGVMCVCYWFRVGCLYFLLPSLPFPLIFPFISLFPFPRFFSCFFILPCLCLGE